jgi:hypothetical protein
LIEAAGRFELKYAIPKARAPEIVEYAGEYCNLDSYAKELPNGRFGYSVRSLYFDGPELPLYATRLDAKSVRTVLRVRTYGEASPKEPVFLETKRKLINRVIKHRVQVGTVSSWSGVSGLVGSPVGTLSHRFSKLIEQWGAVPAVLVHYEREIFVERGLDDQSTRLTLDTNVCAARRTTDVAASFGGVGSPIVPPDWMIMELKFNKVMPAWMRLLLQELSICSESVSKFGLGVSHTIRSESLAERRLFVPYSIHSSREQESRTA